MIPEFTTMCYLERDEKYLMLHRIKEKDDINQGKWLGVGGHFEGSESPEECVRREIWEETGLTATAWQFRGMVTFVLDDNPPEYIHIFTCTDWTGTMHDTDEGVLEWIPKEEVPHLNLWEGDRIFLKLLLEDAPFFSLKMIYQGDKLVHTDLNGIPYSMGC